MAYGLTVTGAPAFAAALQNHRGHTPFFSSAKLAPVAQSAARRCRCRNMALQVFAQDASSQADPQQSQMSVELMHQMETSISEALHAEKVKVQDAYGDGRHVSIEVVSADFEGQSSVKRQRLVYKVMNHINRPVLLKEHYVTQLCSYRLYGKSCRTHCML